MILVVNTAEETLQLVLASGGRILGSFDEHCAGHMNEVMAPAVEDMLARQDRDVTGVACVRGPGSFTGLRLGLAFCTGLCLARRLPLAGLDYLPLLAASASPSLETAKEVRASGEIHVVTHSRTARVYHQGFRTDSGPASPDPAPGRADVSPTASGECPCGTLRPGLVPLGPPQDLTTQTAREIIAERARSAQVTVLGTGLRRNPEAFAGMDNVTLLPGENPAPTALLAAALAAAYDGPPVDALYLRGSDAEENLAMIAAKRGLSEEEALTRMEKALR